MALEKEITYENGSQSTYHKITNIYINYMDRIFPDHSGSYYNININVASYKDKNFRDEKPNSTLGNNSYNYAISSSIMTFDRAAAYEKLKLEAPAFSGSLDV